MKEDKERKNTFRRDQEIFTIPEAANYLRISERLFRDLVKDAVNPIPFYRIGSAGRLIRIKKSDIDSWMENYRSTSDINFDEIVNELMS